MDKTDMTDYKKLIEEYYSAEISAGRLEQLRRAVEQDPDGDPEFDVLRHIFRMEEEGRRNLMMMVPDDMEERIISRIRETAGIRRSCILRKRLLLISAVASVAAVVAVLFGPGIRLSDAGDEDVSKKELYAGHHTGYEVEQPHVQVQQESALPLDESLMKNEVSDSGHSVGMAHPSDSPAPVVMTSSDELLAEPVDPEQMEESYAVLNECFALLGEAFSEARGEYSESVSELNYDEVIRHM